MKRSICLSISALVLAGCVSVLPEKEAPDALYRFGPMSSLHQISSSILVREPEASRLFAGRAIAAEDDEGGLRLVRGVEWTDTATRMMQSALLDTLGGTGSGVAVGTVTGAPTDYELSWRISDFTLHGDTARCRLEATLLDGNSRKVIAQDTISTTAVALSKRNPDRAKALTDAGRACISDIGAFVAAEMQPEEN